MNRKTNISKQIYPTYFAFAAIFIYTLLYVIPAIYGLALSFTDWHRLRDLSTIKFVGFDNYKTVFSEDNEFFKYIINTFEFTIVTTLAKSSLGLVAALMLNKGLKARNFHRMALFFPSIISVVVTGLIFRSILRPDTGFLNTVLISLGLDGGTDWLNNISTAFASVMFVDSWRGIGYIMIIYLAGLQSIPQTYYEAAKIDGAGPMARLFNITLPLLKHTILVNLMLNAVYGFRVFDIVFVLTRGGPARITEVIYTSVYREFGRGNFAVGSALSSVMLIVLLFSGFFLIRYITKQEDNI